MLANLGRCCNQFLPVIPRGESGGLQDLLRSKSIYDLEEDTTVAAYDSAKLGVLKGGTKPLPALDLVGDDARRYLEAPDQHIVLSADEMEALGEPIQPHLGSHPREVEGPAARLY